jgi:hypothetical protein
VGQNECDFIIQNIDTWREIQWNTELLPTMEHGACGEHSNLVLE